MRLPGRMLFALVVGLLVSIRTIAQNSPAVSGKSTVVNERAPQVRRAESPQTTIVTTETAPQPVGSESDVYCFGYVGDLSASFPARVDGAENVAEQTDFIPGDLLYVDAGADRGLRAGQQFWIVTPEQEVVHPVTGKTLGRFYQYRGRAEVKNVEPRAATVRVTHACTDIVLGSYLKPFEPVPIPLARKSPPAAAGDPPSGKATGRIVFSQDGVVALGTGAVVIVDLGAANGLQPGDFVTVYRYAQGREHGSRPVGSYWVTLPPPPSVLVPRTYLGEAAILMVGDRWAVARLTDTFRLIEIGDEVEIK